MLRKNLLTGALIGLLLTAPLTALSYLGSALASLPFLPFDLFNWIVPLIPGPLITFGIDRMIDVLLLLGFDVAQTAKTAEQIMAVGMFVVGGSAAGAVFYTVARARNASDHLTAWISAALYGLPLIAISQAVSRSPVHPALRLAWLVLLCAGWGYGLRWILVREPRGAAASPPPPDGAAESVPGSQPGAAPVASATSLSRRQFLILIGSTAATITVAGAGVGALLSAAERRRREQALEDTMAHEFDEAARPPFPNANDPVTPAPGTRPEYTPIKDHYKVFLQTEPTVIDGRTYVLPITGLVDNPVMLTLDEIYNDFEAFDQYVTLSCISGRVGTTLISTTQWTGPSLQDVLARVGVQPEAKYLRIHSGDGFYETVPLEMIQNDRRIMLCHSWDGHPLPVDHGFPLRVWIPDRFGMKQPKWIVSMELTAEYEAGYWVERGWDEIAQVKTTAVIDTVAVDAAYTLGTQTVIPVGGIAWAGDRQISQVQVRVDGGEWQDAQLRAPLSETTWVIWRYDWPLQAGRHLFEVRCFEGDGTPQIETRQDARPSGATGIHAREAEV